MLPHSYCSESCLVCPLVVATSYSLLVAYSLKDFCDSDHSSHLVNNPSAFTAVYAHYHYTRTSMGGYCTFFNCYHLRSARMEPTTQPYLPPPPQLSLFRPQHYRAKVEHIHCCQTSDRGRARDFKVDPEPWNLINV